MGSLRCSDCGGDLFTTTGEAGCFRCVHCSGLSTVKLVADAGAGPATELWLVDAGSEKIQVIKEVREVTGWGLKEAADLVGSAKPGWPQLLPVEDGNMERAAAVFRRAGATVELRR